MGWDFPIPGLAGSMESSVFLTCWRGVVQKSGRFRAGNGNKAENARGVWGAADSSTDVLAKV